MNEEVGGKERAWPRYVVGFEGIEADLRAFYEGYGDGNGAGRGMKVMERWRTGNGHWNDDERRRGDLVVWEFGVGRKENVE